MLDGVNRVEVSRAELTEGIPVLELVAVKTNVFPSKSEARKMVQQGGFSINKEKVTDPQAVIGEDRMLNGKYMLLQKGKKNYTLLVAE